MGRPQDKPKRNKGNKPQRGGGDKHREYIPAEEHRVEPAETLPDVSHVPAPPLQAPAPRSFSPNIVTQPMAARPDYEKTELLSTQKIMGDGKIFYLDAVKNGRGKALRIAEVSKGKRTIIMVPASMLAAFEAAQGQITPTVVSI